MWRWSGSARFRIWQRRGRARSRIWQVLGLGANRIRDAEAAELAAALGDETLVEPLNQGGDETPRGDSKLQLRLEHNALSAAGLASLVKRLPAGCAATAHFQQPRCAFVSDLCKMGLCSQPSTIYSIGASADGSHAFLALAGGGLLRTRLSPWGLDGQLDGHTDDVNSVEVRGDFVISGSDDRTVRVWRANGSGTDACVTTLDAHSARVWCAHQLRTRVLRQLGWSPLCGLSSADSALPVPPWGLALGLSFADLAPAAPAPADRAIRPPLSHLVGLASVGAP